MYVFHIRHFRRKGWLAALALALAALGLALLLAGCLGRQDQAPRDVPAETDAQRTAWLAAKGFQVSPEPVETLTLRLPEDLTAAFGDYLPLQESQGFPFAGCGGQTVLRCTYAVTNYPDYGGPVQANLYVCGGLLVGGDLTAPGENGFIRELTFPAS